MLTRIAITLLVLAAPAMAWACTSTPVANPVDYLVFGVSAGLFYRLFLQQRFEASEDFHSAVYLSLLVASFGVGAMVAQESTLQNGPRLALAEARGVAPIRSLTRARFGHHSRGLYGFGRGCVALHP